MCTYATDMLLYDKGEEDNVEQAQASGQDEVEDSETSEIQFRRYAGCKVIRWIVTAGSNRR